MIEMSVTREGKARVWLQELPHYSYPFSEVLTRDIPVRSVQGAERLCAGIEVFLHRGGYCPYGLLGAHFVPQEAESLTLQVNVSSSNEQLLEKTLAISIDQVRLGLPMEYAESVLLGAVDALSLSCLGPGTLSFNWAAHGEIGSSPHLFHRLAAILVQLISLDPETVQIEYLVAMIEEFLSS